jgi:hypothetical protein
MQELSLTPHHSIYMKLQHNGKVSVKLSGGKWGVFSEGGKKLHSSRAKIDAIDYARKIAHSERIVIHGRQGQTFHAAPGKGKLSDATIEAIVEGMSSAKSRSKPRSLAR